MQSLFGSSVGNTPIRDALAAADIAKDVGPWRQITMLGVGGLTALGFDRTGEGMLVTSASGQSVIDGTTGEVVYRNRDDDGMDITALKGTRLDHPADERFDMAGIFGGGLRAMTDDGWSIDHLDGHSVLHPPGASIHFLDRKWDSYDKDRTFHLLDRSGEETRVLGFSWTGRTLVCATPADLAIWGRPAPLTL